MKKIKTLDDYINYVDNDLKVQKQNKIKKSKKRKAKKMVFTRKVKAIIAAATLAVVSLVGIAACKFTKKKDGNSDNSISYSTFDNTKLDDLGTELPFTTDKKEYGATTNGKADPNKVVTDPNTGKIYIDKESYNNKDKVGKTEVNTQNGTLEVKPNGNVYEKEDSYEIKDKETNETIDTGKFDKETKYAPDGTPIPDGYAWDEGRKEIVPESEVGKYVYDENGDLVSKETYKETPKTPTGEDAVVEETKEEVIIPVEKSETVTNETSNSKPQDIIITEEPKQEEPKIETTKKEETKEEPKQEVNKVVEEEVLEEKTEEVVEETVKPAEGVTNADGTYTVNGLTFESKPDYEQWIIQGFSGYAVDVDGIMKSEESLTSSKTLIK